MIGALREKCIHSNWGMLAFFMLTSIGLRFFSFFPTVIDHDESTYIVIADAILAGQTYFIDVIDTKPIGIFWIYAGIQWLLGHSIFVMRLVAAMVLGGTGFFLFKAKLKDDSSFNAALAAGLIFIIINCLYTYYGVSPNTETFFTLFTAIALWLFIKQEQTWIYFLVGVLLGFGFIIKYVVAFDALAFGLFLLWTTYQNKGNWLIFLLRGCLMVIGFMLPFLLVLMYYNNLGELETFLFYSFEVSSRYPDAARPWDYIKFFFDFLLRVLPISIFFFWTFFTSSIQKNTRIFGMLWFVLVWIVVLLPGKFFAHYCIQAMVPLCYLAGSFFDIPVENLPKWLKWMRTWPYRWYLFGLLIGVVVYFQFQDGYLKKDYPKEVASVLKEELKPGDTFYIGNYEQILYHLLEQPSPIPYIHSSLIWTPSHVHALKIDQEAIFEQIMEAKPRFILKKISKRDLAFGVDKIMEDNYQLKHSFKDEIFIYERK